MVKGGRKIKILDNKLFIIAIYIILVLIITSLLIFAFYLYNKPINNSIATADMQKEHEMDLEEINDEVPKMYVEVKGAINKPGVYEVTSNNIINDVINFAGGLKENAYTDNINFSKKVSDELVIYVYTKSEYVKNNKVTSECNTDSYLIDNCTESKVSIITATENNNDNNDNNESLLININLATLDQLITLPGIGESKANNIIAYREEKGFFNTINDLKNVSGIGDATFEQLKKFITV